ncbi:hypothetical protein [Oceanithermus profundus]|uniref:Periplasmic heavy metal sensor n=1 Tax=Oceanithermus profundus (strain DSM 14977 / NBRC 100410 / VKM B-2274 / 506) TaxID=670487 RepID=E4U599_OCEP5|nr:hypothetical protein [Oceanithermus profundus]ADR37573.1 hypothetical protein Ocepr_2123 [Oceanithermus profundus DSM 14977]
MKRSWRKAGTVMAVGLALGLALAVGPAAAPGAGAPAKRPVGPAAELQGGARLEALAEVLGKSAEELRAAYRQGGLRALIEASGMEPLEFQRKVLEVQLERLEEAYRAGKLPELRYESLKARLQARKLALEGPTLAELVARSGGDVGVLKAQLRALEEARIDQLLELGVISAQQAERLRANLDVRVERMLNRPAGLNPAAGFGAPQRPGDRGHGFQKPRRPHGPQERPAHPGAGPQRPGR